MIKLSNKYRPKSLDDILSQDHLVGKDGIFREFLKKNYFPNAIFYASPGTGKTTLARVIARQIGYDFFEFNATSIKIDDIRKTVSRYKDRLTKPLIFIDEIHRLSRNQEEVLLPFMEDGTIILIGASTQNPYYTLSSAFRSRSHLFKLNPIKKSDLKSLIYKVSKNENIDIDEDAIDYITDSSNQDARAALNLLESASMASKRVDLKVVKEIRSQFLRDGSSESENHYELTSAMIKSIRGSDIDATLYYLAKLISGGENPEYIARRLAILASEDIGNANPNALNLAASTITIVSKIGYPEARIPLSQLAIYLSSSPKSNSSYKAINLALKEIENGLNLNIPDHIKTHAKEYRYPHDFGGYVKQSYLQKDLKFYQSSGIGFEKTLDEWIKKIKGESQ